jgi:GrpB-like predicted nucleotidyltransferase (UPF0157 family)
LGRLAVRIEHVGSTSVAGLAAKPTIDIDVVIRSRGDLPAAIGRLAAIGYVHRGEIRNGPQGCDAFHRPHGSAVHHLYVCPEENEAFRRHIALRDYLRVHPNLRRSIRKSSALWHFASAPTSAPTRMQTALSKHSWNGCSQRLHARTVDSLPER